MSVVVEDRSTEWLAVLKARLETGTARAALDIQRGAIMNAPHLTGALWASIRAEKKSSAEGISYEVSANTPYARRWEFESAHFTTGGTRYMRGAAEKVMPRFASGEYFRGAF